MHVLEVGMLDTPTSSTKKCPDINFPGVDSGENKNVLRKKTL
jgi:hypothetical protein